MNAKHYKNPLSRHILFGCLAFIVILCFAMGMISFVIFNNTMMAHYQSHLVDIIHFTLARIDIDDLEECMESKKESSKYRELLTFMDQARQNYEMDYLVIVKPIKAEEKYDVMQVASGLFKEEREVQSQREMAIPFLGDMIGSFYPPEFIEEIYKDMHTRYDIKFSTSHTDFGRTYDGAIPIRNKKGEGIALLTAGISLRGINSSMRRYLFITVVCAIILSSIFLTFMLLWLRTRVIIPLKKIEKSAEDFVEKSRSQKDPNVLVLEYPDIHTGDELESLASSLVSMSKNMKEYVEALLASATEMANMKQKVSVMSNIAYRDALTGVKSKAAYDKEKERIDWDIA